MKKILTILVALSLPILFVMCEKTDLNDVATPAKENITKVQESSQSGDINDVFVMEQAQLRMDYLMSVNSVTESEHFDWAEMGVDSSANLKVRIPNIAPSPFGFATYYPIDLSILSGNPQIQSISMVMKCDGDVLFKGISTNIYPPTQIDYSGGIYLSNISTDEKTLYFVFYSLTPINLTGINSPDMFHIGLVGTQGNIWFDDTDPNNFTFSSDGINEYIATKINGGIH